MNDKGKGKKLVHKATAMCVQQLKIMQSQFQQTPIVRKALSSHFSSQIQVLRRLKNNDYWGDDKKKFVCDCDNLLIITSVQNGCGCIFFMHVTSSSCEQLTFHAARITVSYFNYKGIKSIQLTPALRIF